jgi:hypothetical protein
METQITLQRKEYEAEQAKELERLKTRFISTATHEDPIHGLAPR